VKGATRGPEYQVHEVADRRRFAVVRPSGSIAQEKMIVALGSPPEFSIQGCLEGLCISLLSDWDVLNFMYRHRATLLNTQQIAGLMGYESGAVRSALDRLQRAKLVERSRVFQGVRFYRIMVSMDAEHARCLQQLVRLSQSRSGRLLLTEQLKPTRMKSRAED
jgi:DNA-binding MarR family transcriptional regulator